MRICESGEIPVCLPIPVPWEYVNQMISSVCLPIPVPCESERSPVCLLIPVPWEYVNQMRSDQFPDTSVSVHSLLQSRLQRHISDSLSNNSNPHFNYSMSHDTPHQSSIHALPHNGLSRVDHDHITVTCVTVCWPGPSFNRPVIHIQYVTMQPDLPGIESAHSSIRKLFQNVQKKCEWTCYSMFSWKSQL